MKPPGNYNLNIFKNHAIAKQNTFASTSNNLINQIKLSIRLKLTIKLI